jgi:hypothetical protein
VVCVKDVPLGKLLKMIAAAAHVELTSETIKGPGGNVPSYRFYRKRKDQEAIDRSLDAVAQANRDLARWAWDTLVAYAKMPEATLKIEPEKYDFNKIDSRQVRIVSELLASFGTEARDKAFAGRQVTVTYAKAARQDLVRKLFEYACTHPGFGIIQMNINMRQQIEWTDKDLGESLVAIGVSREDSPDSTGGMSFLLYGIPIKWEINGEPRRVQDSWSGDLVKMANALAATKELKLPPPPDTESVYHPKDQFPEPGFVEMDLKQGSKAPPLDRKVTLKLDPTCPHPTLAQGLVILAKTSNLNVIAEDFVSHLLPIQSSARADWGAETTVGATLIRFNQLPNAALKWFLSSEAGTLIGWNHEWRKRHHSLVPKKMLEDIKAKRETTGAELDDIVPLLALSHDQRGDWINNTPDYVSMDPPEFDYLPVWQLYNALAPEDKAVAKTENGLPLAKFDTAWLSQFLSSKLDESTQGILVLAEAEEVAKYHPSIAPLADPEVLKTFTLRVRQVEQKRWTAYTIDAEGSTDYQEYSWSPGGVEKHTYEMSLIGRLNGEEKTIKSTWYEMRFPLYTLKKEAELIKKASARQEDKK